MLVRRIFLLALMVLPLVALSAPARADALDEAKAQGLVGERPDGLLGIVGASTPALDGLVRDINARRVAVFKGIAAEKGQPLAAVQAVSGEEFIARTAPGNYIMTPDGSWRRK